MSVNGVSISSGVGASGAVSAATKAAPRPASGGWGISSYVKEKIWDAVSSVAPSWMWSGGEERGGVRVEDTLAQRANVNELRRPSREGGAVRRAGAKDVSAAKEAMLQAEVTQPRLDQRTTRGAGRLRETSFGPQPLKGGSVDVIPAHEPGSRDGVAPSSDVPLAAQEQAQLAIKEIPDHARDDKRVGGGGLRVRREDTLSVFPKVLPLANLTAEDGMHIYGTEEGERLFRGAIFPDINGDGIDDIGIGRRLQNTTYVLFGSPQLPAVLEVDDLENLDGKDGFKLVGDDQSRRFGGVVAPVGDFNGDGLNDFALTDPERDVDNVTTAGQTYVIWGSSKYPALLNISELSLSTGFKISGVEKRGDVPGGFYHVDYIYGGHDTNGDDIDDLIVGKQFDGRSTGESRALKAYLLFGTKTPAEEVFLSDLDGRNGVEIVGSVAPRMYVNVDIIKDLNGDGLADISIGFHRYQNSRGIVFVLYGRRQWPARVTIPVEDPNLGFTILGENERDSFGWGDSVDDFNGDGLSDIVAGSGGVTVNGKSRAGRGYVIYGYSNNTQPYFNLSRLDGENGFVVDGVAPENFMGTACAGLGDVNGDGFSDVVMPFRTAPYPDGIGHAIVIFGSDTLFPLAINQTQFDGYNGFVIEGFVKSEILQGRHSIRNGDVNGDGVDDITLFSTTTDYNEKKDVGRITIIYGRRQPIAPTGVTLSNATLTEDAPAGTLVGTLRAIDQNPSDGHIFELVSGEGDSGNGDFQIVGDQLLSTADVDFEVQNEYTIRVKAIDKDGLSVEKAIAVQVEDVEEALIPNPVIPLNATQTIELAPYLGDAADVQLTQRDGTALPDWINFDPATHQLYLDHRNASQSRSWGLTLRAEGRTGDVQTANFNVIALPKPPKLPPQIKRVGHEFQINLKSFGYQYIGPVESPVISINQDLFAVIMADFVSLERTLHFYRRSSEGQAVAVSNQIIFENSQKGVAAFAVLGIPLAENKFALAWTVSDESSGAKKYFVQCQFVTVEPKTLTLTRHDPVTVNQHPENRQSIYHFTRLSDDTVLVVYEDGSGLDGSGEGVFGRVIKRNADYTPSLIGDVFQINTVTAADQDGPRSFSMSGGRFGVVYESQQTVEDTMLQLFEWDHTDTPRKIGQEVQVNTHSPMAQKDPHAVAFDDTHFAVAYISDDDLDGDGRGIFLQVFETVTGQSPVKVGNATQVNTFVQGSQDYPSIAKLNETTIVIAWYTQNYDGSGQSVQAQLLDITDRRSPQKLGDEFQVNTFTEGDQRAPAVLRLSDTEFIITWRSDGEDGWSYGGVGQLYRLTKDDVTVLGGGLPSHENVGETGDSSNAGLIAGVTVAAIVAAAGGGLLAYRRWGGQRERRAKPIALEQRETVEMTQLSDRTWTREELARAREGEWNPELYEITKTGKTGGEGSEEWDTAHYDVGSRNAVYAVPFDSQDGTSPPEVRVGWDRTLYATGGRPGLRTGWDAGTYDVSRRGAPDFVYVELDGESGGVPPLDEEGYVLDPQGTVSDGYEEIDDPPSARPYGVCAPQRARRPKVTVRRKDGGSKV